MSWNRLKLNGNVANATASSELAKERFVPPLAEVASMKLYEFAAILELGTAEVMVKFGPVAVWPNTVTVIGPLAAPKGTAVSMEFTVALETRAGTPLNRTSTF